METYDDCWEIVNRRGITDGVQKWYEVQLLFNNKQADAKLKAEIAKRDETIKHLLLMLQVLRPDLYEEERKNEIQG